MRSFQTTRQKNIDAHCLHTVEICKRVIDEHGYFALVGLFSENVHLYRKDDPRRMMVELFENNHGPIPPLNIWQNVALFVIDKQEATQ